MNATSIASLVLCSVERAGAMNEMIFDLNNAASVRVLLPFIIVVWFESSVVPAALAGRMSTLWYWPPPALKQGCPLMPWRAKPAARQISVIARCL